MYNHRTPQHILFFKKGGVGDRKKLNVNKSFDISVIILQKILNYHNVLKQFFRLEDLKHLNNFAVARTRSTISIRKLLQFWKSVNCNHQLECEI